MHLAQMNIGRMRAEQIDDPLMADFVNALDRVNAIAEESPGFVWRLQDDSGNATGIRPFDDERILVNLSVWETMDSFRRFVYRGAHGDYLRRRSEWFEPSDRPTLVFWWVEEGHRPTAAEGRQRLELLWQDGPTAEAFDSRNLFPAATGDAMATTGSGA